MGIRLRESLRGLTLATLLVGSASAGVACGGDDDNNSSSSGGVDSGTGSTSSSSSTGSTSSGSSSGGNDGGSTSSSTSSTSSSSSSGSVPDAGAAATPTFTPAAGTYATPQSVVIASTTPGATIFYTTDGTNPNPLTSVVYASPISVAQDMTIRAMARATGFADSPVVGAVYDINIADGTTAPVTYAPAAGEYNNPVAVGLQTTTAPSTICYTIDGSTPTCTAGNCTGTAAKYSAGSPIPVDAPTGGGNLVVKAIACSTGNANSDMTTSTYSFRAAAPTMTPGPAEVALNSNIALSTATATSGAKAVSIRYNNNGTAPSCILSEQTIAAQAGNVAITKNTTYDAIACRQDYLPSTVASFAYTVKLQTPILSPVAGVRDNDTPVVGTEGATLPTRTLPAPAAAALPGTGTPAVGVYCYTNNATDPVCNPAGTGCTTGTSGAPGAQNVTANNANNVRVRACRPNFTQSDVVAGTYPLTVAGVSVVGTGTCTGAGCPYNALTSANWWNAAANTTFTLTTATTDENIRFSTNGADVNCTQACTGTLAVPVAACNQCSANGAGDPDGPSCSFTATPFTTVKAMACKGTGAAAYNPSPMRTVVYADPTAIVTLAAPLPNPAVTYNNDQQITLSATPSNATICYTIGINNNTDPVCNVVSGACTTGTTYNPAAKPTASEDGTRIRAVACRTGVPAASAVVQAVYQFQVATPTFNPAGPTVPYGSTINFATATTGTITMRSNIGSPAAIDPSCSTGTLGTSRVFDNANGAPSSNYRVIACRTGYQPSAIGSQTFQASLQAPTVASNPVNPNAAPPYNTFNNTSTVTLTSPSTAAPGGKICFTTDGGTPACDNTTTPGTVICGGTGVVTTYAAPFVIGTNATTLRAITCANNYGTGSALATAAFNFTVAAPSITPAAGSYATAQNIGVTNGATNAVNLCWSSNDAAITDTCAAGAGITCETRNAGQTTSTNPLFPNRGTNLTLRVRACKTGFVSSAEQRNVYLFGAYTRTITIDGNNDWSDSDNLIPTQNYNGLQQKTYVAWDANNVYLASQGQFLCTTCTAQYLDFYLRSSANGGTTTTDTLPADPGVNLTTNANVHIHFKTDGSGQGVRVWNGVGWGNPIAGWVLNTDYAFSFGGFATANGIVEYRISRAQLGLTAANSVLIMQSRYMAPGIAAVYAPWGGPAGPPSTNVAANWNFVSANMSASNVPNFAGNIQ